MRCRLASREIDWGGFFLRCGGCVSDRIFGRFVPLGEICDGRWRTCGTRLRDVELRRGESGLGRVFSYEGLGTGASSSGQATSTYFQLSQKSFSRSVCTAYSRHRSDSSLSVISVHIHFMRLS